MKILLDLLDLLDDPRVTGESVVTRLKDWGVRDVATKTIGTNGKPRTLSTSSFPVETARLPEAMLRPSALSAVSAGSALVRLSSASRPTGTARLPP